MTQDCIDAYGNYAIKLLRLQNEMIQTFERYRRGNKQTVEVRHVHIHSGGQGVVGIINPPEDREGRGPPHAREAAGTVGSGGRADREAPGSAGEIDPGPAQSAGSGLILRGSGGWGWWKARGEGIGRFQRINPMQNKLPMHLSRRCGARTRSGPRLFVSNVTIERLGILLQARPQGMLFGKPGGRGSADFRGSTPCKTNCPCISAGGVGRGQGAGAVAGQRRCRTAAAECTAGCPREPRRVTRMPLSTDTTRLKQSRVGARLRSCYGTRGLL
jgi:hypothetical protein